MSRSPLESTRARGTITTTILYQLHRRSLPISSIGPLVARKNHADATDGPFFAGLLPSVSPQRVAARIRNFVVHS